MNGNASQRQPALLVIDVQRGLFRKSTPLYQAQELLQNISLLVERAHEAGAPVVYVQHSAAKQLVKGSPDWELHPDLQPLRSDSIVHKEHGNAFDATPLHEILQARGVKSVVICGLVTHGCVRATCLGALELGYQVTLARDAHSSYSKDAACLIEEWNQKLNELKVELKLTDEIEFS
jgi:nicotinamidase-related amidase